MLLSELVWYTSGTWEGYSVSILVLVNSTRLFVPRGQVTASVSLRKCFCMLLEYPSQRRKKKKVFSIPFQRVFGWDNCYRVFWKVSPSTCTHAELVNQEGDINLTDESVAVAGRKISTSEMEIVLCLLFCCFVTNLDRLSHYLNIWRLQRFHFILVNYTRIFAPLRQVAAHVSLCVSAWRL